jgi:hypothetical protein
MSTTIHGALTPPRPGPGKTRDWLRKVLIACGPLSALVLSAGKSWQPCNGKVIAASRLLPVAVGARRGAVAQAEQSNSVTKITRIVRRLRRQSERERSRGSKVDGVTPKRSVRHSEPSDCPFGFPPWGAMTRATNCVFTGRCALRNQADEHVVDGWFHPNR